jgi:protein-tyrosine phosphatase
MHSPLQKGGNPMIDLHCHILPGIDDGPQNMEEAILMAKQAVNQGIHTIVATPHHQNGRYINEKQLILNQVKGLNEQLYQKGVPLTILPGQEVRLYGEILQDYALQHIATLNETNKYILIEFPSNHVPRYAQTLLYDIQLQGMTPIIAHPERNAEIIERPEILFNLIEKGALSQVTASSLTGDFGKKIKKFSLELIEHGLAHVVASDAHNTSGRSFKLREAYDVIGKEFGENTISQFQDTVYGIIGGKGIYKQEPERIRKKKLFGIF